jgi:hypothetical protein
VKPVQERRHVAANSKATEAGLPKAHCISHHANTCSVAEPGPTRFNIHPAVFWFCFGLTLPDNSLVPPFWNKNSYSVQLYLRSMQLSFWFYRDLEIRNYPDLSKDTELKLLNDVGIFETLDGLNPFCTMRWPSYFGGQDWNVMLCIWNVPHRFMC